MGNWAEPRVQPVEKHCIAANPQQWLAIDTDGRLTIM